MPTISFRTHSGRGLKLPDDVGGALRSVAGELQPPAPPELARHVVCPVRSADPILAKLDKYVKDSQHSHMIHSTISETKNRLSELLARVRRGETLIIMDRKTPVARVEAVPLDRSHPLLSSPAKEWEPRGVLSLPIGEAVKDTASLAEAVVEEREGGW